jgi:Lon protease-like protein
VYGIGCSGVLTHVERLPDGRYNLVLRGLERFRILDENHDKSYRRANVDPLLERTLSADDRAAVRRHRGTLESLLAPTGEKPIGRIAGPGDEPRPPDPSMPSAMSDEDLVNALAQYLDFEPLEKQALLEKDSLRTRAESLVELLEMKIMMARTPGLFNVAN